jgi:hypothetical protein
MDLRFGDSRGEQLAQSGCGPSFEFERIGELVTRSVNSGEHSYQIWKLLLVHFASAFRTVDVIGFSAFKREWQIPGYN